MKAYKVEKQYEIFCPKCKCVLNYSGDEIIRQSYTLCFEDGSEVKKESETIKCIVCGETIPHEEKNCIKSTTMPFEVNKE